MDKWLEIQGFPEYFINSNREVKHRNKIYKDSPVVTLRNNNRQLTIRRNRLLYLTLAGISPLVKNPGVDVICVNGELKAVDSRERRRMLATKRHLGAVKSVDEAIAELNKTIELCNGIKDALNGDFSSLLMELSCREQKIFQDLRHIGVGDVLARDIATVTIEWYLDAITTKRCTATSYLYLRKKAIGIWRDYKRHYMRW